MPKLLGRLLGWLRRAKPRLPSPIAIEEVKFGYFVDRTVRQYVLYAAPSPEKYVSLAITPSAIRVRNMDTILYRLQGDWLFKFKTVPAIVNQPREEDFRL